MADEAKDVTAASEKKEPEKTFTQAELNAIVGERLAQERKKYSDYEDLKGKAAQFDAAEEANKSELQKATEKANSLQKRIDDMIAADSARKLRESVAKEMGVPASLLRGDAEEDLKEQAKAILEFAKPAKASYPSVKDGGESQPPRLTRDDIFAIKSEKERLKAIEENIDLFKR